MLKFHNIKNKDELLDFFKFSYEDVVSSLNRVLSERECENVDIQLKNLIKDLKCDDYKMIWHLLELKLLSISSEIRNISFSKYVIENLINNGLNIDFELFLIQKIKIEDSLINEGFIGLNMKPIILSLYADIEEKDFIQTSYLNFITNCRDIFNEYIEYIPESTYKEITSYPINIVNKYINKEDLLVNELLSDTIALYSGMYNIDISEKNKVIMDSIDEFICKYFKKMNKVDSSDLKEELIELSIQMIDDLDYYFNE